MEGRKILKNLHDDANVMIEHIIAGNLPQKAVTEALSQLDFKGMVHLVAIGKAAWTMAKAASDYFGDRLAKGIVVTKYEHSQGDLPRIDIYEAGHPVSDENTINATRKCVEMAKQLTEKDMLLFLVSGGGSALFEMPLEGLCLNDLQNITSQLLASGADIVEINTIRKRLSAVKAGRFAKFVEPAKVFAIILSDVLGDRLDSIASGPTSPDMTTVQDAEKVVEKYNIKLTDVQQKLLKTETPKSTENVETVITGSVKKLCESAAQSAHMLGYTPYVLTTMLNCEAGEAGRFMSAIAIDTVSELNCFKKPCAIIAGGETVVTIKGDGKGGRNQELALTSANGIAGLDNVLLFSLGSDGTDGPTDAAGGVVDGNSLNMLKNKGLDIDKILSENDSYNGLEAIDGLILTGPTGTNINDVVVLLCR